NPLSLANALRKLHAGAERIPMHATPATAHMFIVSPLTGGAFLNLFSTHPPMEERIARLEAMVYGSTVR
ncbi:MAG: protease HtpX, partial [Bacteroidota bacterium]